jgi:uncharacterized protein YabE (DUF348 family)
MKNRRQRIIQRFFGRELYRHPYAIPVITIVALSVVGLLAMVALGGRTLSPGDSKVVQLTIAGEKQSVPTRAHTVKEFLERADVTINEGDVIEPSQDELIAGDNFRINVYKARPVTIFDGDKRVQALSAAKTPRVVADEAGVKVYPEDILEQGISDDMLREQVIGEKITIDRATPVALNLYGKPSTVRTQAETVGQLLQEKGVVVRKGDKVTPAVTKRLTKGMTVAVSRSGIQVKTVEEEIAPPIEYVEDPSLSFGATAVRQPGKPGKKSVTYEITVRNNQEVSRRAIQQVTIEEPVKQIVARGKAFDLSRDKAAVMAAAGIAESDYPYVDYIVSRESGWRANATNGRTWGLCQALPGSKMASAGADWETNPVTQLRWCAGYAAGKGGWAASYEFWLRNHWW